ncbi:MAG: threonine synthase [Candidatus Eiseniibacteriota bacterium]|nr:MAG: threonine synthase [Candidatus Eisenbacteria bacterium]
MPEERGADETYGGTGSYLSHVECSLCGRRLEADRLQNLCPDCSRPLLARYDLERASRELRRETITARGPNLWRYRELLPVRSAENELCLGEGFTPLIRAARLGETLRFDTLFIKEEGLNPTGSFKARGLAVAVSRALELGARSVSIPSAGNAAGAMSAYAAMAGMEAHVFMPRDVPLPFVAECRVLGAEVNLVEGVITDCGKAAAEGVREFGRFDMSTLKEPYRLEGKKTMGYELAEAFNWTLPDVIVYPTGGGTGLIGMWKAFDEMQMLGWIDDHRPRMVSVQSEGCAPIVRAFHDGLEFAEPWPAPSTIADGLRVPSAVGDFLMLRVLRESRGTAVAVSDQQMLEAAELIGRTEGIFACPEGAATLVAFRRLREQGWISSGESVILFNTGSGLKYAHLWSCSDGPGTLTGA